MSFPRILCAVGLTLVFGTAEAAPPRGTPLFIELPSEVIPSDLGAGGFVVLGSFFSGRGLMWLPTSGVIPIGGRSGVAISRDGKTIAGNALDARGLENAAIWTGGQDWRTLGSFTPNAQPCDLLLSATFGASDDGKVLVGLGWNGCRIAHAFRWEESTGMVDLGSTTPGRASRANNVSGDGQVVVGWQEEFSGFRMGAKWVNRIQELSWSRLRACPSIQPTHRASSTACCQVSVVTVPPFLVRASHTPADVVWLLDNHARSASASATINSSSSAFAMTAG